MNIQTFLNPNVCQDVWDRKYLGTIKNQFLNPAPLAQRAVQDLGFYI